MAGYQYGGTQPIQTALERRQRLQKELDQAREAERTARRINRENQRLEQRIIQTQNRTTRLVEKPYRPSTKPLPEPRYGGPQGLLAATQEIHEHNQRQRTAA